MAISETDKRNNWMLAIEVVFFAILGGFFLLAAICGFIPEESVTPIHIVTTILVFEVYIMPFIIGKKAVRDACFKWKYSKKYHKDRTPVDKLLLPPKRHVGGVIAIWITVWLAILAARMMKILSWELFMAGACVLDILNVWFVRKRCWLSTFVMKKSNCCADCTINGWDAWMFGSAFILCPTPNMAVFYTNIVMVGMSFAVFLIWECCYWMYPERFSKRTNCGIGCANCKTKKCRNHK